MTLIRFAAKVLLFMFALPALGLVTFTGGLGTGLLAALLVGVVGLGLTLLLLPAIAGVGVVGSLLSGAVGGWLGVALFEVFFGAALYGLAIAGVAWLLPGLAIVGFWQTIGAGAILGIVNAVFRNSSN